jgi:hypothetical protein
VRIAFRILILAYVFAAIASVIALFPRLVVHGGDLGTAMIFVTTFGCSQIVLALLFFVAAVSLFRTTGARTLRSFLILDLAMISFLVTCWYCYFFFYG